VEGGAVKKIDPLSGDEMTPEAPGRELDVLFDRARRDGFTGAETEALWSRVGAAIAAPGALRAPHAAGGSGAGATGGIGAGIKIIATIVVGGGLVAGGITYREHAPAPPPVITLRPTHLEASRAADLTSPAPAVSVDDLPRVVDPAATGGRPRVSADRRDIAHGPAGRVDIGESSSAPFESTPGARATATAALAPAESPAATDRASSPSSLSQSAATTDPGPTEGALLLRARQELSSDPSDALALTQEHARRFPFGTLLQEREVLAIEALARLGRTAEARRRLDAFRSRFPQSPHVARLTTLVGP
jgi:hypothetical protein